jgi:outer membrane protein OmpA-like peptidoglycan-associated protein
MKAEMLSWSRSKGLFAGISLQGATLRPDGDENKKLYGRDITNKEILDTGVATPTAGRPLVALLDRYSGAVSSAAAAASLENKGGRLMLGESELRFPTGQSAIPDEAAAMLTQVANTLNDHPDWKVRIEGFTDNVGSQSVNKKLSEARARAVAQWLAEHGVGRSRLTTKGYGEARPVADNATGSGRSKNRRVEVVRL